jgi:cytochrome oxidase Cu insertion factor (SCO1/SenC/PrrC family)
VTTNPDYDTSIKMYEFQKMFGPELLMLRDSSSKAPGLMAMLKAFKVPVGVSDEEVEEIKKFFAKKQGFIERWLHRTTDAAEGYTNDHSRAMYLMAPDNNYVAFYSLDLAENELA